MTDKIKLRADKFVNDKKLKLNYIKPKDLKLLLTEFCEEQIAELKAECDLAIEGRDIKINELEEDYKTLMTSYNILKDNDVKIIKEMGEQIEKMECCEICSHNKGGCSYHHNWTKDCLENNHKYFELRSVKNDKSRT